MKEVLKAMGILIMEKEGLEADDILGTFAKRAEKEGLHVSLVSGDRDLLQVASERIKIRIPKTKGGRTEIEDYYAKDVEELYQVTPLQFIELKALMGDTADNIPGVPKIGQKTATDLMLTYGSIDNIYEHLEEISKKSVRETLREHRDLAELSKVLATIEINGDIPYRLEEADFHNPFTKEAYVLCKKLEFKNLLNRFDQEAVQKNEEEKAFSFVFTQEEAKEIISNAKQAEEAGFYLLQEGKEEKEIIALSLCFDEKVTYIFPVNESITEEFVKEDLWELSKDKTISADKV